MIEGNYRFVVGLVLTLGVAGSCARDDQPVDAMPPPSTQADDRGSVSSIPSIRLTRAFPRLRFRRPVLITHAGDDRIDRVDEISREFSAICDWC